MEAETCRSCSAKVRCAGTGLKSYLSSGKSSAMAISLRPISFHCETTACDALGAALGSSLFAFAKNSKAYPAASRTAAPHIAFFIFFLPHALPRLGLTCRCVCPMIRLFRRTGSLKGFSFKCAPQPAQRGFILLTKARNVTQIVACGVVKLGVIDRSVSL